MDVVNSSGVANNEPNRPSDSEFKDISFPDPSDQQVETKDEKSSTETSAQGSEGQTEPSNGDQGEKPNHDQKTDKNESKSNGFQDRIDELTRARREAERELAYWKSRVTAANNSDDNDSQQSKPAERPKREAFESDEAYQDALIEFGAKKVVNETEAQRAAREGQEAQDRAAAAAVQIWNEKVNAARTTFTDYDSVMETADIPVKPHVAATLTEMDEGAAVIYHLAKNPDVVEKINSLSPAKAALELAKFALSVGVIQTPAKSGDQVNGSNTEVETPARKVSSAPPPARVPGASKQTVQKNPGDMSMEEYVSMRKQQGARWAH